MSRCLLFLSIEIIINMKKRNKEIKSLKSALTKTLSYWLMNEGWVMRDELKLTKKIPLEWTYTVTMIWIIGIHFILRNFCEFGMKNCQVEKFTVYLHNRSNAFNWSSISWKFKMDCTAPRWRCTSCTRHCCTNASSWENYAEYFWICIYMNCMNWWMEKVAI